jgi:hypothetical protein
MVGHGPHRRILLLGPTGVDKRRAFDRVSARVSSMLGHHFKYIDFENECLKQHLSVKSWTTFLAQDIALQATTWLRGWEDLKNKLDSEITVLGLHATYVSGPLGLRCPVHVPSICEEFNPTLIISLVDDVYQMWSRTETRAAGQDIIGRPSFEQLLVARRAELLLGDVILSHTRNPSARHILCATGNSIDALINLIIFDAAVTYLSFPISSPRELSAEGDAHRLAAAEMQVHRTRSIISPLSIDELPIVFKARAASGAEQIEFDCENDRWKLENMWGPDLAILPSLTGGRTFPIAQIENAAGTIQTDVGWRDRRLVLQSKSLAIICPKPPREERITRGVSEEIQTAVTLGILCNIWQKPEWDPNDFVGKQFPPAGSMGIGQTQALVRKLDTLENVIQAAP